MKDSPEVPCELPGDFILPKNHLSSCYKQRNVGTGLRTVRRCSYGYNRFTTDRGATRSKFASSMLAGGKHTLIHEETGPYK